jgi:hypothetical protein
MFSHTSLERHQNTAKIPPAYRQHINRPSQPEHHQHIVAKLPPAPVTHNQNDPQNTSLNHRASVATNPFNKPGLKYHQRITKTYLESIAQTYTATNQQNLTNRTPKHTPQHD